MTKPRDDVLSNCEGCGEPIHESDAYLACEDCDLCIDCAPTYEDMLADPRSFTDPETGDALTGAQVQQIVDGHIAAGGNASDSLATRKEQS